VIVLELTKSSCKRNKVWSDLYFLQRLKIYAFLRLWLQQRISEMYSSSWHEPTGNVVICYNGVCFPAFKLNKFINDDGRDEEPLVQRPLNETMLYLWCDKKNFNNIFLLKIYAGKHLFTALVALIMMAGILTWFFGDVYDDLIVSTTFR